MRIALGIEYDGRSFCGWQIQDRSPSVQTAVESALAKVANHPVRVVCAGRTDTGVHALGQVVHFDTLAERDDRAWKLGCNANLPKSVAVTWIRKVEDHFHARFSAKKRCYRYIILNRDVRPTFLAYRVSWEYRSLDADRMAQAARYLVGEHDFSAFRAAGCQSKSPLRHIYNIEVWRRGDLVLMDVEANAFLHHMVRNLAGVLIAIGVGDRPVTWSREVLQAKDRTIGGVTAPAHGLYLVDVDYRPGFDLPRVSDTQIIW